MFSRPAVLPLASLLPPFQHISFRAPPSFLGSEQPQPDPPHLLNSVFSGKTLIKVAEAEKRLGAAERDFIHTASINFLTPLRNFLEGDWKTISVRDLGPLRCPGTRAALSSEPRARLSSHAGHPAPLGLPQMWLLWTERPGVDDLPGLGLSSPVLTRWPQRPVLPHSPGSHRPLCPTRRRRGGSSKTGV